MEYGRRHDIPRLPHWHSLLLSSRNFVAENRAGAKLESPHPRVSAQDRLSHKYNMEYNRPMNRSVTTLESKSKPGFDDGHMTGCLHHYIRIVTCLGSFQGPVLSRHLDYHASHQLPFISSISYLI